MRHANVRYWHLADLDAEAEDVCFRVESGRAEIDFRRRLMTQSGHTEGLRLNMLSLSCCP